MPDWFEMVREIRNGLNECVDEDIVAWRRGVNRCNEILKNIESTS